MPWMVFQLFNRQDSLKDGIGLLKQTPSGNLRAMGFDEMCPERLLDVLGQTGKGHNSKERIRVYFLPGCLEGWQPR